MKPTAFLNRALFGTALLSIMIGLLGCASAVRNPALERAREAYDRARQDRELVARAGVDMDRARLTLEQGERVWTTEKDVAEAEHLAYLAEKRIEIARATARRRIALEELKQLKVRE